MATVLTIPRIWVVVLILGTFFNFGHATWNSWFQNADLPYHGSRPQDLAQVPKYSQNAFEEADRALSILEEARLCKRDATLRLVTTPSCKDLLQDTNREDIEIIQDLYAVELSRCEIESASVKLPAICQFEIPSSSMEISLRMSLQSKIRSCLAVLHSKPQWWTSYSNHRRDGYQWCLVMKPGFDHNENVKVWKNVYTALDTSVGAIKQSFDSILNWSNYARDSLGELSAYLTRMMEMVQTSAEKGSTAIETRFEQSAAKIESRMEKLQNQINETEMKLTEVDVITGSTQLGLQDIHNNIRALDLAQQSQMQQTQHITTKMEALEVLIERQQENITAAQSLLAKAFEDMHESSGRMVATLRDTTDILGHIQHAMSGFNGLASLWDLMSWSLPVLLAAYFNRRLAAVLALAILSYRELAPLLPNFHLSLIRMLTELFNGDNKTSQALRILGVAFLCWYVLYRQSKTGANGQAGGLKESSGANIENKYSEFLPFTYNNQYFSANPPYSQQTYQQQMPYQGPRTYARRFQRESSAPL